MTSRHAHYTQQKKERTMVSSGARIVAVVLLMACSCLHVSHCWEEEEMEMFDLVEDIGENFYDLLEVSPDATTADIRRSFRRLSLKYHPDKNSAPDASEKFRIINTVTEVLKDDLKRSIYDEILREGLPDWRQPVYYYRRARRMTIIELSLLVLVVATIGQYLVGWAQYFEKWLILQERLERKTKRESRSTKSHKNKNHSLQLEAEVTYYQQMANDSIPHCSKLLPVVIVRKLCEFVVYLFNTLRDRYIMWKAKTSEDITVQSNGERVDGVSVKKRTKSRKERERKSQEQPRVEEEATSLEKTTPVDIPTTPVPTSSKVVEEKSDASALAGGGKLVIEGSNTWSQHQQKQLERALSKYSQHPVEQRWTAIASAVPGKSKEECLERYKQLVQLVRKKKQTSS